MPHRSFLPKSAVCLREGDDLERVRRDVVAGVTVGMIALPLAMALAIASGVEPARGLVTAIVAGFLISTLGGSRVQIGGPTGAFVVIVFDIVERHGEAGLALATIMAAVIVVFLGLARFGAVIKFVPYPVTTGFTTGITLLIFSQQMKDLFGLDLATVADGMIGGRHKPNVELLAHDVANLGSVFCGGIAATGAIARTAANVKAGGRTPLAGIEVNGPFFFGVADRVKDALRRVERPPRVFALRLRRVSAIDATGMHALEEPYEKCRREGTTLLLAGVHAQPLDAMLRYGLFDRIGEENLFEKVDGALERAREVVHAAPAARPPSSPPEVARERDPARHGEPR